MKKLKTITLVSVLIISLLCTSTNSFADSELDDVEVLTIDVNSMFQDENVDYSKLKTTVVQNIDFNKTLTDKEYNTDLSNFLHYFNKDYTSLYSGIYGYDNIVMNWLWLFLVYVMFCCLLYLTILIINKIGKTMSIYCGILFIGCIVLITALFRYVFSAELVKNILNFFMKAAGFVKGDTINYFYPSFSLLLIIGILGTTSFVVIRRTELK